MQLLSDLLNIYEKKIAMLKQNVKIEWLRKGHQFKKFHSRLRWRREASELKVIKVDEF